MDKEIINWKELLYPYEQTVDELMLKFNYIRKEYLRLGLYSPIESVEGRVKSAASIIEKVSRKGISRDKIEEEVEDIAGIRLICQFVEDIPKIIDIIRSILSFFQRQLIWQKLKRDNSIGCQHQHQPPNI